MKTIWKFPFSPCVLMPKGAKILAVKKQYEGIYLWAEVDSIAPIEHRYFEALGTGHEIEGSNDLFAPNRQYLGTVLLDNGNLVLHIYEDARTAPQSTCPDCGLLLNKL